MGGGKAMKKRLTIHTVQEAGFGADLLLAAGWMFLPEESIQTKTSEQQGMMRYLKDAMGSPDERLKALFLPKEDRCFLLERYKHLLFLYDPVQKIARELSFVNQEGLLGDLLLFWKEETDPQILSSLEQLVKDISLIRKEAVDFLLHLADRLQVVYQTKKELLSALRFQFEGTDLCISEEKCSDVIRFFERMPKIYVWQAAVSLFALHPLTFLAREEESCLMLMGLDCEAALRQLEWIEPQEEETDLLPVFLRALDDPIRLRMLTKLREKEIYVGEFCRLMEMPQPKLIYHLNLLKDAGLIAKRQEGRRVYYSLVPEKISLFCKMLEKRFVSQEGAQTEK